MLRLDTGLRPSDEFPTRDERSLEKRNLVEKCIDRSSLRMEKGWSWPELVAADDLIRFLNTYEISNIKQRYSLQSSLRFV